MTLPADIANRALDAAGTGVIIGDLEEGGRVAETLRRIYVPTRQQLLRTARWRFARKQADLFLLASRNAQNVAPDLVTGALPFGSISRDVIRPWIYEYAYPIDCLQVRFVPENRSGVTAPVPPGNRAIVGAPPAAQESVWQDRLIPARFLVASDPNFPGLVGAITDWSQMPDLQSVIGVGNTQRTVILTNVQNAQAVYTADIEYPDEWDSQFQEAMVCSMAAKIVVPLMRSSGMDIRTAISLKAECIQVADRHIAAARVADANEGWSTTDHIPDWIEGRFRMGSRAGWGAGGQFGIAGGEGGCGYFGEGYGSMDYSNSSVY
jgi:hypothetical protein